MPLSRSKEEENLGAKQEAAANPPGKEPPEHPVPGAGRQAAESAEQRRVTAGRLEEAGHGREIPGVPPKERKVAQQEIDRAVRNAAENSDPLHGDAQRVPAARNHLEKKPLAEDAGGGHEAKAGRDVHENSLKAVEAATVPIQREQLRAAKVQGVAGKTLERDSGIDLKAKAVSQVEPKDLAVALDSLNKRNVAGSEQHLREHLRAADAEGADEQQPASRGELAIKGQVKEEDPQQRGVDAAQDPQQELQGKQRRVVGGLANGAEKKPSPENAAARKLEKGVAIPGDQKQDRDIKPNRDLKLQADLDLRRRRRDLLPHREEEEEEEEAAQGAGVFIGLNPLPDVKVNDLRSALETRLNQVAEGAQQVVHSRQIKQMTEADGSM